jgi:hypothetical protein
MQNNVTAFLQNTGASRSTIKEYEAAINNFDKYLGKSSTREFTKKTVGVSSKDEIDDIINRILSENKVVEKPLVPASTDNLQRARDLGYKAREKAGKITMASPEVQNAEQLLKREVSSTGIESSVVYLSIYDSQTDTLFLEAPVWPEQKILVKTNLPYHQVEYQSNRLHGAFNQYFISTAPGSISSEYEIEENRQKIKKILDEFSSKGWLLEREDTPIVTAIRNNNPRWKELLDTVEFIGTDMQAGLQFPYYYRAETIASQTISTIDPTKKVFLGGSSHTHPNGGTTASNNDVSNMTASLKRANSSCENYFENLSNRFYGSIVTANQIQPMIIDLPTCEFSMSMLGELKTSGVQNYGSLPWENQRNIYATIEK